MISQSETEDQNIFVCTSWVLSRLEKISYRIDQHPIVEAAFENGSHHFFRNDKVESGQGTLQFRVVSLICRIPNLVTMPMLYPDPAI